MNNGIYTCIVLNRQGYRDNSVGSVYGLLILYMD